MQAGLTVARMLYDITGLLKPLFTKEAILKSSSISNRRIVRQHTLHLHWRAASRAPITAFSRSSLTHTGAAIAWSRRSGRCP